MIERSHISGMVGLLIFLALPPEAAAQSQIPLPRADVAGFLSWQAADTRATGPYSHDDWHSSLFAGGVAGWHWTPQWKTEVDYGGSTEARAYRTRAVLIDGQQFFQPSRLAFSRRTLGLSQQYQFFENAWFHPHLALGVNVTWERRREEFDPLIRWDRPPDPREFTERRIEHSTDLTVRPFLAGGFKSYVTPRGFFRADLRVAFRNGPDETLLRAGFGIDF